MAFRAVYVNEIGYSEDNPFAFAATDDSGNLIPEKWDNGLGKVVTATALTIQMKAAGTEKYVQDTWMSNISVNFYVTDSRVALLCSKYDKGGEWSGGVAAAVLNVGSRIAANLRSKGKVMLGQIRYEWIAFVAYKNHYSIFSNKKLDVCYQDNEQNYWIISLDFGKIFICIVELFHVQNSVFVL